MLVAFLGSALSDIQGTVYLSLSVLALFEIMLRAYFVRDGERVMSDLHAAAANEPDRRYAAHTIRGREIQETRPRSTDLRHLAR